MACTFSTAVCSDSSATGASTWTTSSTCSSTTGAMYFPQFSTTAPSAPQTGHSAFIASAVQASSQTQTGASGGVVASVDSSCSGATYLQQSSTTAPSAPQTAHSALISSAVHASSQVQTGGAGGVVASGCASVAGTAYLQQFSTAAPSAPQTAHSAFISSNVQASSQVHTGVSAFSSANAVAGSKDSTMHSAIARLNNLFFIMFPPFAPQLRRGYTFLYKV